MITLGAALVAACSTDGEPDADQDTGPERDASGDSSPATDGTTEAPGSEAEGETPEAAEAEASDAETKPDLLDEPERLWTLDPVDQLGTFQIRSPYAME